MSVERITAAMRIYQIKIELAEVRPVVWRRVLVPNAMSLAQLHHVLQRAMGWQDHHLHEFEIDAVRFAADFEEDEDLFDEAKATLGLVAGEGDSVFYLYDFGDGWNHVLKIETASAPEPGGRYPRCIAGARQCPPEDVGGAHGYAHFLEVLRNPKHEDHDDFVAWADGFDPQGFDVAGADKRLEPLAWVNSV